MKPPDIQLRGMHKGALLMSFICKMQRTFDFKKIITWEMSHLISTDPLSSQTGMRASWRYLSWGWRGTPTVNFFHALLLALKGLSRWERNKAWTIILVKSNLYYQTVVDCRPSLQTKPVHQFLKENFLN